VVDPDRNSRLSLVFQAFPDMVNFSVLKFILLLDGLTDFLLGSPQLGPQEANHGFSKADVSRRAVTVKFTARFTVLDKTIKKTLMSHPIAEAIAGDLAQQPRLLHSDFVSGFGGIVRENKLGEIIPGPILIRVLFFEGFNGLFRQFRHLQVCDPVELLFLLTCHRVSRESEKDY
jgi:hypothetical protein